MEMKRRYSNVVVRPAKGAGTPKAGQHQAEVR